MAEAAPQHTAIQYKTTQQRTCSGASSKVPERHRLSKHSCTSYHSCTGVPKPRQTKLSMARGLLNTMLTGHRLLASCARWFTTRCMLPPSTHAPPPTRSSHLGINVHDGGVHGEVRVALQARNVGNGLLGGIAQLQVLGLHHTEVAACMHFAIWHFGILHSRQNHLEACLLYCGLFKLCVSTNLHVPNLHLT